MRISIAHKAMLLLAVVLMASGCNGPRQLAAPENVTEYETGMLEGFIAFRELPNSLLLIPPPPFEGSAAFEADRAANQAILESTDSARREQASMDAILYFPEAMESFNAIIGMQISREATPHLYTLLRRTLSDAALSTYRAKKHYQRPRPFMINGRSTCTPEDESHLTDGSYPSGHAAIGWAWALILCEIFPDKCNQILDRGRAFGDSRAICNVHWQSDVDEGRTMGAATLAMLHSNPVFQANLRAAKKEVKAILKQP